MCSLEGLTNTMNTLSANSLRVGEISSVVYAYRADVPHAIIHETAAGRLVQPISNKDGTEYPRIKIGSSNRLKIDLLALLRDQEVIRAVDGEVAFEGFEPANGSAPLRDFFVYVLQIERTGCLLLRPNGHFSLSDDPKDNEDILEIEDLDNPCQGMNGMLYVPAPSRNRSNYMVFSGEPGCPDDRFVGALACDLPDAQRRAFGPERC